MVLLERRLDNVVHRLGFGQSRAQARQMINHGHVTVNGKRVDIPSYRVRIGDVIRAKNLAKSLDLIRGAMAESNRDSPRFFVAQPMPKFRKASSAACPLPTTFPSQCKHN